MILNNSRSKEIYHDMPLYHKVWGEVKVVDFDDNYVTIGLANNQTKKLLLSSIGTHLFYSSSELEELLNSENKQTQLKKADEFRKHYRELGIDDLSDDYSAKIADYEDLDWSAISKPTGTLTDDADELENEEDYKGEDIFDHYSEEVVN